MPLIDMVVVELIHMYFVLVNMYFAPDKQTVYQRNIYK